MQRPQIGKAILAAGLCLSIMACQAQPEPDEAVGEDAAAGAEAPSFADMPAGTYSVDPNHTSVVWKVDHLGLSKYTARFLTIDGTLEFDPAAPEASKVSITIDPASVHTGFPDPDYEDFDKVLGEDAIWFNSGEHPEITFTSTALDMGDGRKGTLTGDLTFLGVTKPVTLDVTFNGATPAKPRTEEAALGFSATAKISRAEWGLDTYAPAIGDEVELLIEAEFEMPKPEGEPASE